MNRAKRILIFYLSIGSGHLSAATALESGIKQIDASHKVVCEDLFTPGIRDSLIPELLSLNATVFFTKIYDSAWHSGSMMAGYEMLMSAPMIKKRVMELVSQHKPDVLVCTHSLPCSVLTNLRLEGMVLPQIYAVSTDFMVHPYWPIAGVDGFIVATDKAADKLIERGMESRRIRKFGIPIDPRAENLACQNERRVTENSSGGSQKPHQILVLAGGKRLAPYVSIWPKTINMIRESIKIPAGQIHWNIVFGKPSVFSQMLTESTSGRTDITLFNYVSDFLSLLNWQDLVVTKPGGLILAECAALGIPVILVSRGSGQEAANSEAFILAGAGIGVETEMDVLGCIQKFIHDPLAFQSAREAACCLGKPDSSRLIAEWLLQERM